MGGSAERGGEEMEGKVTGQEKKNLCKPCALGLRAEGHKVEALSGRSAKVTCEQCGRRRFGMAYAVEARRIGT